MTTVFDLLIADHDRHRQLLSQIEAAEPASARQKQLFHDFKIEVMAHADAEEQSLYAEMLAKPALQHEARHSVSEHKEISDFIETMETLDPASAEWRECFAKMRHRYEHHIDEEESEMFPEAEESLSGGRLSEIGEKFRARKPAEIARAVADDAVGDSGDHRE